MHVPFIDLSRSLNPIKSALIKDWEECLDQCQFVGGAKVKAFEKNLAATLGVKHALSCANGTDALMIGLQALGIKPGMKVALPNMTFWATYEALAQLGAQGVLVDVETSSWHMDIDELKKAHAQHRLDAVMFVHLFGWTSPRLDDLRSFCKAEGLPLLEDGAQAYGVCYGPEGVSVLRDAELATLSFYPAKVLGGCSDGGAITGNHDELMALCGRLCNHGRKDHYSYSEVGWNSRMSGINGAFLGRMLELADGMIASRVKGLQIYEEFFAEHQDLVQMLKPPAGVKTNGYLAAFILPQHRGLAVQQALTASGIGAARVYPEPLHVQEPAKGAIRASTLERSSYFCEHIINLPLFAGIREEECLESAQALLKILKS